MWSRCLLLKFNQIIIYTGCFVDACLGCLNAV